jgi:hypothetical protein
LRAIASLVRCRGALALHLVGEVREREHHLVHGGVQGALAVFEVEEDAGPGRHDLLQRVRRLDLLAAEPDSSDMMST